tara:strand:- start:530 stop:2056 length:1527 start_codon:yes stop_codon:yes gene_type:complete
MAFDWKSFSAAFLADQAKGMEERRLENVAYKDELDEEYKSGLQEHSKRKQVVGMVMNQVKRLKNLGASPAQIKAAESAGPNAIFELSTALAKQSKTLGNKQLSHAEIDTFISGADLFEDDQTKIDEFIERSRGMATAGLEGTEKDDRSFLKRALGYDMKSGTRARYDERASAVGGMSRLDIVEMARQEAYDSIMGGSFLTLDEAQMFDPLTVNQKFSRDVTANLKALSESPSYINETDQTKRRELEMQTRADTAKLYADRYGDAFLENIPSVQKEAMGVMFDVMVLGEKEKKPSRQQTDIEIKLSKLMEKENARNVEGVMQSGPARGSKVEVIVAPNNNVLTVRIAGEDIPTNLVNDTVDRLVKDGTIKMPKIEGGRAVAGANIYTVEQIRERAKDFTFEEYQDMSRAEREDAGLGDTPIIRGMAFGITPSPKYFKDSDEYITGLGGNLKKVPTDESVSPTEGKENQVDDFTGIKDEKTLDAAFDALPVGAIFTDEDGEFRRKTRERK